MRCAARGRERRGKNGLLLTSTASTAWVEGLAVTGERPGREIACSKQGFWREFDVPAQLPKTDVSLNQRFHLKPLAAALDGAHRACVVLVDRAKARIFEVVNDAREVEKLDFVNELTRRGKSAGWGGWMMPGTPSAGR